jgi:hypothetical protein
MVVSSIIDAIHWRKRAKQTRALAQDISDPAIRANILRIAVEYEQLATNATPDASIARRVEIDDPGQGV